MKEFFKRDKVNYTPKPLNEILPKDIAFTGNIIYNKCHGLKIYIWGGMYYVNDVSRKPGKNR